MTSPTDVSSVLSSNNSCLGCSPCEPKPPSVSSTRNNPICFGSASARARANPPIVTASTHASVPPASIKSASPRWIDRNASPTACAPAAHAVAVVRFGPRKSCAIDTCPAAALHKTRGTKNGESFLPSLPRSSKRPAWVTSETWPIPLPIDTPARVGSTWNRLDKLDCP